MPDPISIPPGEWEKLGKLMREIAGVADDVRELRKQHDTTDRKIDKIEARLDKLDDRVWDESTGRFEIDRAQMKSIADAQLEAREAKIKVAGIAATSGGVMAALVEVIKSLVGSGHQ